MLVCSRDLTVSSQFLPFSFSPVFSPIVWLGRVLQKNRVPLFASRHQCCPQESSRDGVNKAIVSQRAHAFSLFDAVPVFRQPPGTAPPNSHRMSAAGHLYTCSMYALTKTAMSALQFLGPCAPNQEKHFLLGGYSQTPCSRFPRSVL